MAIKYGDLLKQLRIDNNLTQQELANLTHYTKQHISRIENNDVVPTYSASKQFSNILKFDFVQLSLHIHNFDSYRDYVAFNKLSAVITTANIKEIEETIKIYNVNKTFNYGALILIKHYANAIVKLYKNPKTCINYCLKSLNLKEKSINTLTFTPLTEDLELTTFMVLAIAYATVGKTDTSLIIFEKLYNHCKIYLFNKETNYIEQNYFTKKFYVQLINNFSYLKFLSKEYSASMALCDEAVKTSKEFNVLYMLHQIFKVKMENAYCLDDIDLARKYYEYVEMLCNINEKDDYFVNVTNLVKNNYPKILE